MAQTWFDPPIFVKRTHYFEEVAGLVDAFDALGAVGFDPDFDCSESYEAFEKRACLVVSGGNAT